MQSCRDLGVATCIQLHDASRCGEAGVVDAAAESSIELAQCACKRCDGGDLGVVIGIQLHDVSRCGEASVVDAAPASSMELAQCACKRRNGGDLLVATRIEFHDASCRGQAVALGYVAQGQFKPSRVIVG